MADVHDQLRELIRRLEAVEAQLQQLSNSADASASDGTAAASGKVSAPPVEHEIKAADATPPATTTSHAASRPRTSAPAATVVMGFTAAAAFVLATVYFIKLVFDTGWLTPGRQVGLAALAGAALIMAGVQFGKRDRGYAAWLPAVGVIVLYLAVFGGHLYYGLLPTAVALGAVAAVTLCAMWLARQFDRSIYSLFAVGGVYLTPMLLEGLRANVVDLVVYYTAWSLLFSFAAIEEGRRLVYVLAMLFAIIGFDLSWRMSGADQWLLAALYQCAQFLIFAATTLVFSSRHRTVLSRSEATVHGAGLFYFYGVEYVMLHQHVPELAPWLALCSVVVVLLVYAVATRRLNSIQLEGSAALTSTYASVVTAHVVYLELVPSTYFSWAALVAPIAAWAASTRLTTHAARMPVYAVSGVLLVVGLLGAFGAAFGGRGFNQENIPGAKLLLFVYGAMLYVGYGYMRRFLHSARVAGLLLYAGHAAMLVASLQMLTSDFLISLLWAVFAVVLLLYAIRRDDAVVGKSSLLIFAASGIKVLLFDLDGRSALTRVLVLVVLSVSLYLGGWLYQKVSHADRDYTGNPLVDRQISKIARLIEEGYGSDDVALKMRQDHEAMYGSDDDWSTAKVEEIRAAFSL